MTAGEEKPARKEPVIFAPRPGTAEPNGDVSFGHNGRAKRRLRAVLRRRSLPAGTDLVVVARPRAVDAASDALERELVVLINAAARPAPGVPR